MGNDHVDLLDFMKLSKNGWSPNIPSLSTGKPVRFWGPIFHGTPQILRSQTLQRNHERSKPSMPQLQPFIRKITSSQNKSKRTDLERSMALEDPRNRILVTVVTSSRSLYKVVVPVHWGYPAW